MWECSQALDHNRHGSVTEAALEVLEKCAVERQRLELLSLEQRAAADIVRAATGYVQPQQPAQGYWNPAGDVDPFPAFPIDWQHRHRSGARRTQLAAVGD
jgi:hypothetical protein